MMQCTYEQQFYLYVYFILYSEIATQLRLNAKKTGNFHQLTTSRLAGWHNQSFLTALFGG